MQAQSCIFPQFVFISSVSPYLAMRCRVDFKYLCKIANKKPISSPLGAACVFICQQTHCKISNFQRFYCTIPHCSPRINYILQFLNQTQRNCLFLQNSSREFLTFLSTPDNTFLRIRDFHQSPAPGAFPVLGFTRKCGEFKRRLRFISIMSRSLFFLILLFYGIVKKFPLNVHALWIFINFLFSCLVHAGLPPLFRFGNCFLPAGRV